MKYKTIHIYGLSICTGPPRDPKRAVDQSERESEFAWSACCAALVKRTLQWISVCDGDSVLRNFWGAGRARAHYNKLKASSRKQRLGEIWLWIFSSHFFCLPQGLIFFPSSARVDISKQCIVIFPQLVAESSVEVIIWRGAVEISRWTWDLRRFFLVWY